MRCFVTRALVGAAILGLKADKVEAGLSAEQERVALLLASRESRHRWSRKSGMTLVELVRKSRQWARGRQTKPGKRSR